MGRRNHKHRDIHYQGFIIALDFNLAEGGWSYLLINEITDMDYGSDPECLSFRDALRNAKAVIDELILEREDDEE
jgi:hypothetical protein